MAISPRKPAEKAGAAKPAAATKRVQTVRPSAAGPAAPVPVKPAAAANPAPEVPAGTSASSGAEPARKLPPAKPKQVTAAAEHAVQPAGKPQSAKPAAPVPPATRPQPVSSPSKPMVSMMTKTQTQAFKGYDQLTAFGKANLDALVQANQVFAKGVEEISKEVFTAAQTSLESAATATKAILAARTLKDVVELNADFTKASFEKLVANSTKLGEMSVKLATDTMAPLTARVNVAVEQVLKPAA